MDTLTIIAGLCISTAALAYLAHTDPKRRRVFGQPGYQRPRRVWSPLLVLSAPGVWLLTSENGPGFAIWLGALTVIGWGVATTNPARAEAWRETARASLNITGRVVILGWSNLVSGVRSVRAGMKLVRDGTERIALLEARVDQLEAEIQRIKPAPQRFQAIDVDGSCPKHIRSKTIVRS